MKMNLLILRIIVWIAIFCEIAIAQPFYYYHYRDTTISYALYKTTCYNFANKTITFPAVPQSIDASVMRSYFGRGLDYLFDLRWDGAQRWLCSHLTFELFDLSSNTKTRAIPSGEDNARIDNLIYASKKKKLFIDYKYEGNLETPATRFMYVVDPVNKIVTNKINKTCSGISHDNEQMFLSNDDNILYYYIEDTLVYHQNNLYNRDSLCYFSTTTNSIIAKKPISQYGYPNAYSYSIKNGHAGKGGVVSVMNISVSDSIDKYYRIYDFDNDRGSNFVHCKGDAVPFFTNNGQYMVVSSYKTYDNGAFNSDGIFKIYVVATGQLLKTIILPERGDILTFDKYPNKLFYLLWNSSFLTSSIIDVDSIVQASAGLNVKLINSLGLKLTGGSLQYYDSSWKDAVNNGDGTFSIDTKLKTISLRMTYAFGTQTKSNVTVGKDTVVFQTVNTQVKLINSLGAVIDTGKVQYYFNSWQTFGSTANGVAVKELLPNSYTFKMNYASATKDKAQDVSTNSTVVFQTVPATVQLKNSQGNLMDQGMVQYYFNSWQNFGSTANGVVVKELLPNSYTFKMAYAAATKDKAQDISANPVVVFQTVPATVQLKDSQGNLIDQGTVQYYFNSWQNFGSTANGVAVKELLPNSYTFKMAYAAATRDKAQDISVNNTVVFQTVLATVQLKSSTDSFLDGGTVQYYFNSWQTFGSTANGVVTKELLPASMTFRANYNSVQKDKVQDISANNIVDIGL